MTMELEAYVAYCKFCASLDIRPLALGDWRNESAKVPNGFVGTAGPLKGTHNPGYSILNPQARIAVTL